MFTDDNKYKDYTGSPIKYSYSDVEIMKNERTMNNPKKSLRIIKSDSLDFPIINKLNNTLVLIFADAETPGGCIESSNGMQEESLFRRTALFKFLKRDLYPILDLEAIYCPNVPVYRMSENFSSKIIEDQNYNFLALPCVKCNNSVNTEEQLELLKKKIELMISIAIYHKHSSIVLGAWGTGAFGNNAKVIAKLFKEVIDTNKFLNYLDIYFCILGSCINDFEQIFNE